MMLPASPDGRDLAGTLSALTGLGVLANATGVRWDGGPVTTDSVFGGKLITESRFYQWSRDHHDPAEQRGGRETGKPRHCASNVVGPPPSFRP